MTKNNQSKINRINLSEHNLERLEGWLDQLKNEYKGIKLSKTQLVAWLIDSTALTLSKKQKTSIKNKFFDEVQLAQWALAELKRARASGQDISLSSLIGSAKPIRCKKPNENRPMKEGKNVET